MKKRLIDLGGQETYANAVTAIRPVSTEAVSKRARCAAATTELMMGIL